MRGCLRSHLHTQICWHLTDSTRSSSTGLDFTDSLWLLWLLKYLSGINQSCAAFLLLVANRGYKWLFRLAVKRHWEMVKPNGFGTNEILINTGNSLRLRWATCRVPHETTSLILMLHILLKSSNGTEWCVSCAKTVLIAWRCVASPTLPLFNGLCWSLVVSRSHVSASVYWSIHNSVKLINGLFWNPN